MKQTTVSPLTGCKHQTRGAAKDSAQDSASRPPGQNPGSTNVTSDSLWICYFTSLNLFPHLSNRDEHTSLPLSLRMGRNQEDSRAAASTSWAHSLALGIVYMGMISQSLALTPPGCPDTISFLRGENQRAWGRPAQKRWTQHGNPSLALE